MEHHIPLGNRDGDRTQRFGRWVDGHTRGWETDPFYTLPTSEKSVEALHLESKIIAKRETSNGVSLFVFCV